MSDAHDGPRQAGGARAGAIVACVVLAAGRSSRLGRPKQLLSIGGQPLVRHAVAEACASTCAHVGVILGAEADAIGAALAGLGATLLHNDAWASGLASSLQVGLDFADSCGADALLISVCDQPHLGRGHLDALCAAHREHGGAVASAYAATVGVPAIFERARFAALRALRGDRGAASILRDDPSVRTVAWPEGAIDLDTPADVAAFAASTRRA